MQTRIEEIKKALEVETNQSKVRAMYAEMGKLFTEMLRNTRN